MACGLLGTCFPRATAVPMAEEFQVLRKRVTRLRLENEILNKERRRTLRRTVPVKYAWTRQ